MIKLMSIIGGNPKINEAKDIAPLIADIEKYTDRNDHTNAVLTLAKFLGQTKYVKLIEAIQIIHRLEGSIPSEISKYRSILLKDLIEKFKSKYGQDAASKLNGAF